jgi:hypothetical protein
MGDQRDDFGCSKADFGVDRFGGTRSSAFLSGWRLATADGARAYPPSNSLEGDKKRNENNAWLRLAGHCVQGC